MNTARNTPAPPTQAPLQPKKSKQTRWALALFGGTLFALGVFLFLAWIQPALSEKDRIDVSKLPTFKIAPDRTPPPAQQPKKETTKEKPRKKKPPKRKKRKIANKPVQRPTRAPAKATSFQPQISGLGSSLDLGSMLGSGGGGIKLDLRQQDAALEVGAALVERSGYERRRQLIRERQQEERSFADSAAAEKAEPKFMEKPAYPSRARSDAVHGFVRLRLLINREGYVEEYEIVQAQPEGYFEEAIDSVIGRWTFRPAKDSKGRPIESWLKFKYVFKLEDA